MDISWQIQRLKEEFESIWDVKKRFRDQDWWCISIHRHNAPAAFCSLSIGLSLRSQIYAKPLVYLCNISFPLFQSRSEEHCKKKIQDHSLRHLPIREKCLSYLRSYRAITASVLTPISGPRKRKATETNSKHDDRHLFCHDYGDTSHLSCSVECRFPS